jgi:hypothetical protein
VGAPSWRGRIARLTDLCRWLAGSSTEGPILAERSSSKAVDRRQAPAGKPMTFFFVFVPLLLLLIGFLIVRAVFKAKGDKFEDTPGNG